MKKYGILVLLAVSLAITTFATPTGKGGRHKKTAESAFGGGRHKKSLSDLGKGHKKASSLVATMA